MRNETELPTDKIVTLRADILSIEGQLSEKKKTHVDGALFSPLEYDEWRAKALKALKTKQAQAKRLSSLIDASSKLEEKILLTAILSALCKGDNEAVASHIDLARAMVLKEESDNAFNL